VRVARQPLSQLGSLLPLERPPRIEVVRAIQNAADHVPFSESEGVVPHRIEHPSVMLSLGSRPTSTGGTVAQLGRARRVGSPRLQLLR
jgi:hypothetical protein